MTPGPEGAPRDGRASAARPSISRPLSYAIVTPVRDEAEHISRLGGEIAEQRLQPAAWVIVDTGSTDETMQIARELVSRLPWVSALELRIGDAARRGEPIVKAFHAALATLDPTCDVVAKLDADISVGPEHYDRIVAEFEGDSSLGITGGTLYEVDPDGVWRQRHGTGAGVWGADRAYRRECLEEILPLAERMGWDTVDLVAAQVRGWEARPVSNLPFLHLRREGERESSRFAHWMEHGRAAHFMGYRLPYLTARTAFRAIREPAALGIVCGYVDAAFRSEPQCPDVAVRDFVRGKQRLSQLPDRAREALRRRSELKSDP